MDTDTAALDGGRALPGGERMRTGPGKHGRTGVTAFSINISECSIDFREKMTAPEGAGPLRRVSPDHSLRNVDDDHGLVGHDHQTESAIPTLGDDQYDLLASCRDGSAHAGCKRFGMRELPVSRRPSECGVSEINISGSRIFTTYHIPEGDVREQNGASEIQILRIGLIPFLF